MSVGTTEIAATTENALTLVKQRIRVFFAIASKDGTEETVAKVSVLIEVTIKL